MIYKSKKINVKNSESNLGKIKPIYNGLDFLSEYIRFDEFEI